MRKYIFAQAVDHYHSQLIKVARQTGVPTSKAEDALQTVLCRILKNKVYVKIKASTVDWRTFAFIRQMVRWELGTMKRHEKHETSVMCPLPEDEEESIASFADEALSVIVACPYCHEAVLNQHGACALCHTILGAGQSMRHNTRLTEIGLSYHPDLDQNVDVHQAVAQLSPLEQTLVRHIISGNSTLDDMATLSHASRVTLWRTWTEAKEKLKLSLAEYGKLRQSSKTTYINQSVKSMG